MSILGLGGFRLIPKLDSEGEIINNTFVGGIAGSYGTASAFATRISISASSIQNFQVDGDDISCFIDTPYNLNYQAFRHNYDITYYRDLDGMMQSIPDAGFRSGVDESGALVDVYLPGVTSFSGLYNFYRRGFMNEVVLTNAASLGATGTADESFFGGSNGSAYNNTTLYVPVALQTINAGGPDPDINYFTARGGTVVYVQNYTAPSAITDLAVTETGANHVLLNWSAPTSTNGIMRYEVLKDGVRVFQTTDTNCRVAGLTNGVVYRFEVKAIDIYYNYSTLSNKVYELINGAHPTWSNEFVANYNFNDDVLDNSGGGYNGTANNITYQESISGKAIVLNDTSSSVDLGANTLTGGKSAFTIVAHFKMQTANDVNVIYASWLTTAQVILRVHTGQLQFYTHTGNDAGKQVGGSFGAFTDTTTYHVAHATYDGDSMKLYLDKVLLGTMKQTGKLNLGGENEFWGQRGGVNFGNHLINAGAVFNYAFNQADVDATYDILNGGNELI